MSSEKIKFGPCFELYRRLNVLEDLSVGACVCVDLESEINVGSLKTNNLNEIWKEKIKQIRVIGAKVACQKFANHTQAIQLIILLQKIKVKF